MYLLDTNHCSKLLSGHPGLSRKLKSLGDVLVATCVVARGELVYMAEKSANPADNRGVVAHFLDDIEVFPIDEKTADVYGELKAALIARFGPREKASCAASTSKDSASEKMTSGLLRLRSVMD